MRFLLPLFSLAAFSVVLLAQPPQDGKGKGAPPAPKNLHVLKPEEVRQVMRGYAAALGGNCQTCHVQGDFASDENPHKEIARKMIVMTKEINAKFPDGKDHVTCYTCHRGAHEPLTAPPAAETKPAEAPKPAQP